MRILLTNISLFLGCYLYADCSDLDSLECFQWSEYCEWNDYTDQCEDIYGGSVFEYGPYQFAQILQSEGMRDGPHYLDATLYYPIGAEPPFSNVVIAPGWSGTQASISDWGYWYASHGLIAMTVDHNDPINDDWEYRGVALLDAIETIKQENVRNDSPVYGMVDINSFAVCGYSMGGGGAQWAATIASSLDAVVALNPALAIYDTINCTDPEFDYYCLVPEHLNHSTPVLIITGENEDANGTSATGYNHYEYTPNATDKMFFQVSNSGHEAAYGPYGANGEVGEKSMQWLKFHLFGYEAYCDTLLIEPENASLFITNVECDPLSLTDINSSVPNDFRIQQNYPNPFNPITSLRYDLPENGHVNIIIYDMLGREVKTLINQTQDAGYRSIIWDATNDYGKPVSAGIYLYQIQAGEYISTKKMVLLK